jgi:hypothetical protein
MNFLQRRRTTVQAAHPLKPPRAPPQVPSSKSADSPPQPIANLWCPSTHPQRTALPSVLPLSKPPLTLPGHRTLSNPRTLLPPTYAQTARDLSRLSTNGITFRKSFLRTHTYADGTIPFSVTAHCMRSLTLSSTTWTVVAVFSTMPEKSRCASRLSHTAIA